MLKGKIKLNGDKSISHRILIFGSIASSKSIVYNLSQCEDVQRTLNILKNCNIKFKITKNYTEIYPSRIKQKVKKFYCGNSGTTARFMLGFLPSIGVSGTLYGDKSLSKRPMKRLIDPLLKMNVKIKKVKNNLPIQFQKSKVNPINFTSNHPSAQIKSSLIFAALSIYKKSTFRDIFKTRNHTENIIDFLGGNSKEVKKFTINGFNYNVPGDISSASFIIAGALLMKGSEINIQNVLFNKTRIGFINVLKKMNAKISISNIKTKQNEKTADISVKYSQKLKGVILNKKEVVNMIDEIPIFALIACYANGTTKVSDAIELRYKESDRIESIVYNLKKCGAKISELNDGFIINKSKMLYNASIKDFNDHRIAMMCEILYLVENKKINTLENKVIKTSFPNFYQQIRKLYEKV